MESGNRYRKNSIEGWRKTPFTALIREADRPAVIIDYGRSKRFGLGPEELRLWLEVETSFGGESLSTLPDNSGARLRILIALGLVEPLLHNTMITLPAEAIRYLHIVSSGALYEYIANTDLWRVHGNAWFARYVTGSASEGCGHFAGIKLTPAPTKYVLYHSWLPGFVCLDEEFVSNAWRFIRNPQASAPGLDLPLNPTTLIWTKSVEVDLLPIEERVLALFIAIQNPVELKAFLSLVRERRPKCVVEIGTARGGMFYSFCQLAAPDAMLVSIDLPGGLNGGGHTNIEREVLASFGLTGQQLRFLSADSHDPNTRQALIDVLGGRAIDLLFIDGDHDYAGVKRDFEMYTPLLSPDGIVALHDICLFAQDGWGETMGVGQFWSEIKTKFNGEEIVDNGGTTRRPLNPGERWKWGIGIIKATQLSLD